MKKYSVDDTPTTPLTLTKINAKKALFNTVNGTRSFGDYLLPLSDNCYSEGDSEAKSIVFIQGIASHPLRSWTTDGGTELWPPKFLPEYKVYAVQYETKLLDSQRILYNLKDYGPDEFARELRQDLKAAGITDLYFVCYSMGGLVVRSLIVDHLDNLNVNGVLFVACSLSGQTMSAQIKKDVGPLITGLQPFLDPFDSISPEYFREHFYDSGFPVSKVLLSIPDMHK